MNTLQPPFLGFGRLATPTIAKKPSRPSLQNAGPKTDVFQSTRFSAHYNRPPKRPNLRNSNGVGVDYAAVVKIAGLNDLLPEIIRKPGLVPRDYSLRPSASLKEALRLKRDVWGPSFPQEVVRDVTHLLRGVEDDHVLRFLHQTLPRVLRNTPTPDAWKHYVAFVNDYGGTDLDKPGMIVGGRYPGMNQPRFDRHRATNALFEATRTFRQADQAPDLLPEGYTDAVNHARLFLGAIPLVLDDKRKVYKHLLKAAAIEPAFAREAIANIEGDLAMMPPRGAYEANRLYFEDLKIFETLGASNNLEEWRQVRGIIQPVLQSAFKALKANPDADISRQKLFLGVVHTVLTMANSSERLDTLGLVKRLALPPAANAAPLPFRKPEEIIEFYRLISKLSDKFGRNHLEGILNAFRDACLSLGGANEPERHERQTRFMTLDWNKLADNLLTVEQFKAVPAWLSTQGGQSTRGSWRPGPIFWKLLADLEKGRPLAKWNAPRMDRFLANLLSTDSVKRENALHNLLIDSRGDILFNVRPESLEEIILGFERQMDRNSPPGGYLPSEDVIALLYNTPQDLARAYTRPASRALTSTTRFDMVGSVNDVTGDVKVLWGKLATIAHSFLTWKYDAMGGPESLLANFANGKTYPDALKNSAFGSGYYWENQPFLDPQTVVVYRRGFLAASKPNYGTILIPNKSPDFKRGNLAHFAYWNPWAKDAKELGKLKPLDIETGYRIDETKSGWHHILDYRLYGRSRRPDTPVPQMSFLVEELRKMEDAYQYDRVDTRDEAYVELDEGGFEFTGYETKGLARLADRLLTQYEKRMMAHDGDKAGPPVPDLAFVNPNFAPLRHAQAENLPTRYSFKSFEDVMRFRRFAHGTLPLAELYGTELYSFLLNGIYTRGKLIMVDPEPPSSNALPSGAPQLPGAGK